MATTISGKLINGIGEPIKNCKITLKSISTSTTVIAHTTASQTPSAAGDYSLSVEPGKYKVTLCVDGFPPEYVGDIQVYKDSPNGTLNYFLGLPQDNDLRPDAIKHFEAMVDKVASQVAEVEKSKLAAEASARSAAASADRASQITGLSTVADAISMASVPLPDVWIPFNDGLQMITGYGEEVKVGAVTVAKMASFNRDTTATYIDKSGTLRTAEINEPRFEKEGLLIEGASTNLLPYSNDFTKWNLGSSGSGIMPIVTSNYTSSPDGTKNASRLQLNKGSGTTENDQSSMTLPITTTKGQIYSISIWIKSNTPGITYKVSLSFNGGNVTVLNVTDKWKRFSITSDPAIDNARYPRIQLRGTVDTSDSVDLCVFGIQMENLPFSTSYIPTGANQVTRSQDKCWVPSAGNNKVDGVTIAGEFDVMLGLANRSMRFFELGVAPTSGTRLLMQCSGDGILTVYGNAIRPATCAFSPGLNAMVSKPGANAIAITGGNVFTGGDIYSRVDSIPPTIIFGSGQPDFSSGSQLFGHIRNLRIWHRPFSVEQLKGLK